MVSERTESIIHKLKLGGHWLNFSSHRYSTYITIFQVFRFVYLVVGLYLNWSLLFLNGMSFLVTPTAVFMPLCLNVVTTSAVLLLYHKQIERVLREGEKNLSSYQLAWEKELIEEDSQLVSSIADILTYGMNSFGGFYLLGPVLVDGVRAALGYEEPYLVPLPLDGYLQDGKKERNLSLYSIIFFSITWFLFGLPNTSSFECLIFYCASYTTSEIKILKRHLKNLYDKNDEGVGLLPDWDLGHIIRKHQQIIRLNRMQRKYITLAYMFQCVISTFSFCFIMFLLNQVFGNDILITLLGGIFILMILGLITIMCYSGEYLEEMSAELFQEICDLPWYRQSPPARQNILLMLVESNRTLVLDYKEHFPLNLKATMQIINTAYSYYMLMKSVT